MAVTNEKSSMKKHKYCIGDKSLINFRRQGDYGVKLNFTKETDGRGAIQLYFAGNYVKTIRIDLFEDMKV